MRGYLLPFPLLVTDFGDFLSLGEEGLGVAPVKVQLCTGGAASFLFYFGLNQPVIEHNILWSP